MSEEELEAIATAFRRCAYNAYLNTLVGSAPPRVIEALERMKNPRVGDWVIETTTVWMGTRSDLDGIGILEEIAREPFVFSGDPDFVWDEEVEGAPHPTETVYYLRTMDGRRFRWTNASIVAVPTELRSAIP